VYCVFETIPITGRRRVHPVDRLDTLNLILKMKISVNDFITGMMRKKGTSAL